MVWEHQCTKCNSTSCQHRTPLAATFIYDKHWGLSWNILQPAQGSRALWRRFSLCLILLKTARAQTGGESLTWDAAKREGEEHQDPCCGHGGVWSLQAAAPSLLLRCSLQGWLQIYTNAMSKLLNCNIKQPAESVTSTMRPGIFMEVLTFSGNGLRLLGNWFWLDTWLIDQDKYHKFWVVKSKQTGFWTKETSLGF